ncbi:LysR substrate-binding domain-containing protein [Cognatiyoonia sp. IB215182]|uniref:LysR substrate-binding domain-containing protein n=1 Tax=Cognatiyoonia sp. IB215182 TaxID=3097353 RepID=UPI002A126FE7|nr:LysR substrate-binding domain-containing protein [Cognatiyoonia sp. IB215182]MDX8355589.1 LysR substrate-binding domain-containing protein [Cognatiyoonia sp. IB215182]
MKRLASNADKYSDVHMTHRYDRPSLPPSEALIAFRRTRDLGSFAAAARAEGANHATILRRVATLEAWLGSKVFERTSRGVQMTPAGQRFSKVTDDVFAALEGAADRWRPNHAPIRIALSVLPSFARLHLIPVLAELLESTSGKPRWRVEISTSHRPVSLGNGEYDVAVRYGGGRWDGVTARPLGKEDLVAVAHADFHDGRPLEPGDVARMPLIHDSDAADWRRWFKKHGLSYQLKPSDLRFEDYDVALAAAERGLGALLLRLRGNDVPKPFVVVDSAPIPNLRRHWVVTANDEDRPRVLEFADTLQTMLAAK